MSKDRTRPTESELQILAVLWKKGPSTVREVYDTLGKDGGYTTILKFMQIMTEKGLLLRQRKGKQHVYRPASPPERTQKHLVSDLIEKAFGGSLSKLMVAALSADRASSADLTEIRGLLDQIEATRAAGEHSAPKGDKS